MRSYRLTLGPKFNEGARLTWAALARRRWSQADLRRAIVAHPGEVSKILYGDKLPNLKQVSRLERLLKIPVAAWTTAPTQPFAPPARAVVEAELAANPLPAPRRRRAA